MTEEQQSKFQQLLELQILTKWEADYLRFLEQQEDSFTDKQIDTLKNIWTRIFGT